MSSASRVSLLLLISLVCLDSCFSATIPRNFDNRLTDDIIIPPKKRPFCNAFTGDKHGIVLFADDTSLLFKVKRQIGCGRKRSQGNPGMPVQDFMRQIQFVDEDSVGSLGESDAIDELSRQILSEAKLWEAIQDASAEIARRKQKEAFNL